MGITIHYRGKAKSLEAIDQLIAELKETASILKKKYWLVDKKFRGAIEPSWGYGYGFIPTEEDIQEKGIEFFPKMVSSFRSGYFKIWKDCKYSDKIREAFCEGREPKFMVDTRMKGIHLNLHPKCGTLSFTFDINTLEITNYEIFNRKKKIIHHYNGLFCKTQFAGLSIHILVCQVLKRAEKYIDFSDIFDEAAYYHTQDIKIAEKSFEANTALIESVGNILKSQAKGTGAQVVRGDEL